MDMEVLSIWVEMATVPSKQKGIAVFSQYLVMGVEKCRRGFHGHAQLHHMGWVSL